MSEFDKLMRKGSKRPEIQRRQENSQKRVQIATIIVGISVIFAIIPPHLGLLLFIPAVGYLFIVSKSEWMG